MGWVLRGAAALFVFYSVGAHASVCPSKLIRASPPTLSDRAAGVLLAVSSLPSSGPVGDFGDEAFRFVEFLSRAKQRWWQILPLNPPDEVNSPFKSDSSLAIDIAYLSPEHLAREGLIASAPRAIPASEAADYQAARQTKRPIVREALETVLRTRPPVLLSEFEFFKRDNAYWLQAHTDFEVLRARYGAEFTRWPAQFRVPENATLAKFRRENEAALQLAAFEQFLLHRQWTALRKHAHSLGIGIIGDMPLYVGRYSADVWSNQDAFLLDRDGNANMVSGYPPCNFYKDGQLWDTPVYNWAGLKKTGYTFWLNRLRRNFSLYDVVRLDHFMGLHRFYAVGAGESNARNGKWLEGDGAGMLEQVQRILGKVPLVAEDLGASVPPEVHELRKKFGIPGMRITQFGYDPKHGAPYHRTDSFEPEYVAYTGNHDMTTLAQSLQESGATESHWAKLQALYGSKANTVIVPAQDWLRLGEASRMNIPGTWATAADPRYRRQNWTWRLLPWLLNAQLERDLEAEMAGASRQ